MTNMPLRVGVMGCASIAERMVIPAILLSPHYTLALVASREEPKGKAYAEKFGCGYVVGYENLVASPDVDVVYMPLPTGLHLEWGLKVLDSGKHLLLEKSLASNYTEAQQLVDKAREKSLLIQENFMFACHRQFTILQDLLASGRIGTIRCIRSSFGFPPFPDEKNIRYSKALSGGALLDAGAYTIKIASLLLGNGLSVGSSCLTLDPVKEVDLYGGLFMHDAKGVVVETAFGFDHFYQCSVEIWGTKGKISAERIFTAGPGISPVLKIEEAGNTEMVPVESDNHFLNLLNHFAGTIRSGSFEDMYSQILEQARLVQSARDKAITFDLS